MQPTMPNPSVPARLSPWEAIGCREDPFRARFDQRFVYLHQEQQQAFEHLIQGVRAGACVSLITGGGGSGKSTLIGQLALELKACCPLVLSFPTPPPSLAALLEGCREQAGGAVDMSGTAGARAELRAFVSRVAVGARPLLLIDEAQSLSDALLGELFALAAPNRDGQHLLQIVLAGDPSLVSRLEAEPIRSLGCRLGYHYRVSALAKGHIRAFIRHRLSAAGCENCDPFSDEAVERIAEYANGVIGRVNTLCRLALFFFAKTGEARVSVRSVERGASTALLKGPAPAGSAPQTVRRRRPQQSRVAAGGSAPAAPQTKVASRVKSARRRAPEASTDATAVGQTATPEAAAEDPKLSYQKSYQGNDALRRRSRGRSWMRLGATMALLVATSALLAFHVASLDQRPRDADSAFQAQGLPAHALSMGKVIEGAAPLVMSESAGSVSADAGQAETPALRNTDPLPTPPAGAQAAELRQQEKSPPVTTALRLGVQVTDDAEVAQMLARAQAHFDADRLMAPRFDNALAVYRQILRANPGNRSALQGIAAIRARLLGYAHVASDRGDAVGARSYRQKVLALDDEWGPIDDDARRLARPTSGAGQRLPAPRNLHSTIDDASDR
jgi:type II secretory pathway predicted ATPase ExeA